MSPLPTVVLTGASAGIGLAALEALTPVADVIAISRTRPPVPEHIGHWVKGDLLHPERVATEVVDLLRRLDRGVDGLIHCAVSYGSDHRHDFLETPQSEWDELMAINTRSQFILTSRLLPELLRRPQAFIVSVTSDVATQPAPRRIAYACSKAACYALFTGLAAELAQSCVSVVQMIPKGQVITRGVRRRRPADFPFTGYSDPAIFKAPFQAILASRGAGLNGRCLLIS